MVTCIIILIRIQQHSSIPQPARLTQDDRASDRSKPFKENPKFEWTFRFIGFKVESLEVTSYGDMGSGFRLPCLGTR